MQLLMPFVMTAFLQAAVNMTTAAVNVTTAAVNMTTAAVNMTTAAVSHVSLEMRAALWVESVRQETSGSLTVPLSSNSFALTAPPATCSSPSQQTIGKEASV